MAASDTMKEMIQQYYLKYGLVITEAEHMRWEVLKTFIREMVMKRPPICPINSNDLQKQQEIARMLLHNTIHTQFTMVSALRKMWDISIMFSIVLGCC